MAFTPEQEAAILDFVTKSTAAATAPAAAAKPAGDEGTAKTIAQQAKEEIEAAKSKSVVEQAKEAFALE